MRATLVGLFRLAMAMALGGAIGWGLHAVSPPRIDWRLSDAIPSRLGPLVADCVAADDAEAAVLELAVAILEHPGKGIGFLRTGAHRQLAAGLYRTVGRETVPVCAPDSIYRRVGAALARDEDFIKLRLVDYSLDLFTRIPEPSEVLADKVAEAAFQTHPLPSELVREMDLRPKARAALAAAGSRAARFAEQAFAVMSAEDSLGTGAAQIAAAAGHPEALRRIETLMNQFLDSLPDGAVVPWDRKMRLYELAYAIAVAPVEARKSVAPIVALMKRKVQSQAPPFGMVSLAPKQLCRVLRLVEGEAGTTAAQFEYCRDGSVPLDQ